MYRRPSISLAVKAALVVCAVGVAFHGATKNGGGRLVGRLAPKPPHGDEASSLVAATAPTFADRKIHQWNTCGAWKYSDATIDFADGFVFPWGANRLSRINIVSQGRLQPSRRDTNAIANVGVALSMVPGVSRFAYEHTPSNTYRFAWSNAAVGRVALNAPQYETLDASIELFRNGDSVITTNNVARRVARVLPFAHDGFGQGDDWVRANFTNAEEILSVGYPQWADAQVDANRWLFKFTVSVGENLPESVRLSVGGRTVAAEPGGVYVFLLDKAVAHEVEAEYPEEFEYSWADANGGGGNVEFDTPRDGEAGSVKWTDPLTVSPAAILGDDEAGQAAQPLAASWNVADASAVKWSWGSGDAHDGAALSSTNTAETMVLSVGSACFMWVAAEYGGTSVTGYVAVVRKATTNEMSLAVYALRVLGVNDDGDEAEIGHMDFELPGSLEGDDDIAKVSVVFHSPQPTNGVLVVESMMMDGWLWRDRASDDYVAYDERIALTNCEAFAALYRLEGTYRSRKYDAWEITARFLPEGGGELTAEHPFTFVDRVAEPVCADIVSRAVLNPCCAVIDAETPMAVSVGPEDFQQDLIRWRVVEGSATFPRGNTGTNVVVVATGEPGEALTLEVEFGDCPGRKPTFAMETALMHCATVFPCVVTRAGEAPYVGRAQMEEMLDFANVVFRQVGLRFALAEEIKHVENKEWTEDGIAKSKVGAEIRDYMKDTGGVEVYFIEGSGNKKEALGNCNRKGVILRKGATPRTLAHELGHACGLLDIYNDTREDKISDAPLYGVPRKEWLPLDWNNGTGVRFYEPGLFSQRDVISRLLMLGYDGTDGVDIPSGSVYGIMIDRNSPSGYSYGMVNVGRNGMILFPPRSQ